MSGLQTYTIRSWLLRAQNLLETHSASSRLDALLMLQDVLGLDAASLLAHDDRAISASEAGRLERSLEARQAGFSIAAITGKAHFWGLEFFVNRQVLVPRPESEALLRLTDTLASQYSRSELHNIIDIGTGSGCLAISLKRSHPEFNVTAIDISDRALAVAAKNSLLLQAPIVLKKQNLLTGDKNGYHAALANLPYVPTNAPADSSIAQEPKRALFSGKDGLNHYRRLFAQLRKHYIRFVITESLSEQHTALEQIAHTSDYVLTATDGLAQLFTRRTTNL